jgi:hypothetical protein
MICPHCGEETVRHGSLYRYSKLGCRCEICKAAQAKRVRAWRAKNPDKYKAGYQRENDKRKRELPE